MRNMIRRLREKRTSSKVVGPNVLKPLQSSQASQASQAAQVAHNAPNPQALPSSMPSQPVGSAAGSSSPILPNSHPQIGSKPPTSGVLAKPGPRPASLQVSSSTANTPSLHSPPLKPSPMSSPPGSISGGQTPKQWSQSQQPRLYSGPNMERTSPSLSSPRGSMSPQRPGRNVSLGNFTRNAEKIAAENEDLSATGTMVVR